MQVKLTDVAKKAGVSPTTVSRVINNRGYISQATIQKVKKAMQELNYQPNSIARSLQGKNSYLIGLIFPTIKQPFYAELIENLESILFTYGYKCILCDSQDQSDKERHYLNMLTANKVDGIIAGAHNTDIEEYSYLDLPIVSFDRDLGPNIPIVSSDNYYGAKLATEALVKANCHNIGIITGNNEPQAPTTKRLLAYQDIIQKYQLTPHIYTCKNNAMPTLKQAQITKILTNEKLDGIFCTDDLTALQVWNTAQELQIDIPHELKLIGYDGTAFIKKYAPYLATIAQPIEELAHLLVELLLQRINKQEITEKNYVLPPEIIYQKSLL